jgi:hypothetical protein
MEWLEKTFAFSLVLAPWQQLGLAFLLGSFTVATLSDIKRLTAQREFLEVWVIFLLGVLAFEIYDVRVGKLDSSIVWVKWGLIALLSFFSFERIGVLFRLAKADVAALAAAASLLTPILVLVFYGLAKIIAWVMQRIFWPNRTSWPFLPVVSLATVAVMVLGLLWGA